MDQVGRQLKEAQTLQTEILRKSRDHETLNSEGQQLISTSDRDGDTVQAVLDSVNGRWTELSHGMSHRLFYDLQATTVIPILFLLCRSCYESLINIESIGI